MKARFKYEKNENGFWCFGVCIEYPNCNCEGHYVWEKVKKLKQKEKKNATNK